VYRQKQRAEVKWMDDSVATHCISCNARFSLTLRKVRAGLPACLHPAQ